MGRLAAELLLEEADEEDGTHEHRSVVLQPELVVRASSAAAP
jgi:LacI family transcriptional regulator